jgi:MOSC domain-containing protein YiiM
MANNVASLISVNVGLPRDITHRGRLVPTGIFKSPVAGRVMVRRLGLEGDAQADLRVHGGEMQAVCAYPAEHYEAWERELGTRYPYAQFGENLTVAGLTEDRVRVGDAFLVGTAVLQVTRPRTGCFKLETRLGIRGFAKVFLRSGRTGFYLRVVQEGEVGAGDAIDIVHTDIRRPTIAEVVRQAYGGDKDATLAPAASGQLPSRGR